MYCDWPVLKRCCFCLPLRKGVLFLGYFIVFSNVLAILFNILDISLEQEIYDFSGLDMETEFIISIVLNCIEILVTLVLIVGAHKNKIKLIKIYFYFILGMAVLMCVQQIVQMSLMRHFIIIIHSVFLFICYMMLHTYLIFLIRSLLKKMEISDQNMYDNQLHQIVSGEIQKDNPPYSTTVVPIDN
ncbi:uncharacterized protein LOC131842147 [Achroia grisella]|uniref:uncharacterized protein LOC131842147 n=1 Tax=Achroia grisella TaxID=688607 RepID=UPI0027D2BB5B|nr:uncharacterized protein LOC131842147 [Achroia grisella]